MVALSSGFTNLISPAQITNMTNLIYEVTNNPVRATSNPITSSVPPVISILSPAMNSTNGNSFTLSGTFTDSTGTTPSVYVLNSGMPYGIAGTASVYISQDTPAMVVDQYVSFMATNVISFGITGTASIDTYYTISGVDFQVNGSWFPAVITNSTAGVYSWIITNMTLTSNITNVLNFRATASSGKTILQGPMQVFVNINTNTNNVAGATGIPAGATLYATIMDSNTNTCLWKLTATTDIKYFINTDGEPNDRRSITALPAQIIISSLVALE